MEIFEIFFICQAYYNWAIAISDRAKMRGRTKEAEEFWKQVGSISTLSNLRVESLFLLYLMLDHFLHYFGSLLFTSGEPFCFL